MSLKAFPEDSGLPELKIASNPGLMREVFQRHLRPLTREGYHIQDCLLSRVRYRQNSRCVLQYTLRIVEPRTGRERSQWVTGLIYAQNRAKRIWKKLRAADPGRDFPEASRTFEPVSFIPDLRMLVQVFPYDRRLPTLPVLMAGPPPDLEPLLLTRFGPGDWRAEVWNIELIRYRAQLGAVLRYAVQARDAATGRKEERRFFLKVYRKEEGGERTFQVLQALWEKADSAGEGFTVVKPIAYMSDLHALIMEEAPGASLEEVILHGRDTVAAVRKVARALAVFNQDEVVTTRRHFRGDEISDVKRAGALLQWACPQLSPEVGAIVGAITVGLEETRAGPTHRDLKPDHILLDGDRLALLDLDSFAEADPVLDVASLLARLAGMPSRFSLPPDRVRMATRAFAEEYFANVPRAWRRRLPLHYAGAALKVAVGFFLRQEPGWPEKVGALVEEARDALAGRVW